MKVFILDSFLLLKIVLVLKYNLDYRFHIYMIVRWQKGTIFRQLLLNSCELPLRVTRQYLCSIYVAQFGEILPGS